MFGAVTAGMAAVIAGNDGTMTGWSVTKDGEEICSDPTISISSKEIECD